MYISFNTHHIVYFSTLYVKFSLFLAVGSCCIVCFFSLSLQAYPTYIHMQTSGNPFFYYNMHQCMLSCRNIPPCTVAAKLPAIDHVMCTHTHTSRTHIAFSIRCAQKGEEKKNSYWLQKPLVARLYKKKLYKRRFFFLFLFVCYFPV